MAMPRAQNRQQKVQLYYEVDPRCPTRYIIYLWSPLSIHLQSLSFHVRENAPRARYDRITLLTPFSLQTIGQQEISVSVPTYVLNVNHHTVSV